VRLQLRPRVLLNRGDVDVQVRVPRHAENRRLTVAWDSDQAGAGSREFALEGDRAPVLFQWWNQDQAPAHYVYEARVFDDRGRQIGDARADIHSADEGR